MLSIQIPNPEKFTDIQFTEVNASYGAPYVTPERVLLGVFTLAGTGPSQWNSQLGRQETTTIEKTYVATAKLTDAVIAEGLARAEKVKDEIASARWDAERKIEAIQRDLDARTRELKETESVLTEVRADRDRHWRSLGDNVEKITQVEARMRTLEGHLAKVRKYFGDKAYNEAIEAPGKITLIDVTKKGG